MKCWPTLRSGARWTLPTRAMAKSRASSVGMTRRRSIFFFQAEDGIRGFHVTGVQTCALPILGTMTALVFFGAHEWSRPVFAFAGAAAATLVVYRLARGRAGAAPERLILAGVIVTTFLSSAIVFITTLMDATRIRSFTFWLLGDLSGTTSRLLGVALVGAAIGVGILVMNARSLNLMVLGERYAFDLGVEVGRVRLTVFA